jgi:hypothetical protein
MLELFQRGGLGATLLHCAGKSRDEESVIHIAAAPKLPGDGVGCIVIASRNFR